MDLHVKATDRVDVLAIVGMPWEARIARGPGISVHCRMGGDSLAEAFRQAVRSGCQAAVSFGVAGGLDPGLRPGDFVVASAIQDDDRLHEPDPELSRRLLDLLPEADYAPIVGVDRPISAPDDKLAMHLAQRAAVVDMESHLVARLAQAHGLRFASVRVVLDPAKRRLPASALLGLRRDAPSSIKPVFLGLLSNPGDAAGIARLAWDAQVARSALRSARLRLGNSFGIELRKQDEW